MWVFKCECAPKSLGELIKHRNLFLIPQVQRGAENMHFSQDAADATGSRKEYQVFTLWDICKERLMIRLFLRDLTWLQLTTPFVLAKPLLAPHIPTYVIQCHLQPFSLSPLSTSPVRMLLCSLKNIQNMKPKSSLNQRDLHQLLFLGQFIVTEFCKGRKCSLLPL